VHHPVCAPYHRAAVLFEIVGAGEGEDAPRATLAQAAERVGGIRNDEGATPRDVTPFS